MGDLALALGCGEDAASYALRLLRTAGLVTSRKQGRTVFYRLAPDFLSPLLNHCWSVWWTCRRRRRMTCDRRHADP